MLKSLLSHYKKAEWEQSGVAHSGAPNQGISPQTLFMRSSISEQKKAKARGRIFSCGFFSFPPTVLVIF
jgi:hypothetical protein